MKGVRKEKRKFGIFVCILSLTSFLSTINKIKEQKYLSVHCSPIQKTALFYKSSGFHRGIIKAFAFWNDTQCMLVAAYRRLGTKNWSHLQGSISPFFLDCLPLHNGTHRMFRNVPKQRPIRCVIFQKSEGPSTAWFESSRIVARLYYL